MFRAGEVTQGNANVNWISGRCWPDSDFVTDHVPGVLRSNTHFPLPSKTTSRVTSVLGIWIAKRSPPSRCGSQPPARTEFHDGGVAESWQSINYETAILRNTASIEHTPEALGVETLRDVRFGGTWARDVQ
jgi:hypothetical protein